MSETMSVYGIIPARLQSSRLPRKLLLDRTGKPLIQYAWEAACRSAKLDDVIVATDSEEIATVVREFGGRAEMTGDHPSGTDRIAEVARRCCPDAEMLVNIQGDEPEIDPSVIDRLVTALRDDASCEMATVATPISDPAAIDDTSCVKVVCAADGRALYFSRAAIPWDRDGEHRAQLGRSGDPEERELPAASPWLLHLGIYAYRRPFLLALTQMPPSCLEKVEKLEQLRALEAGAGIRVVEVRHRSVGIDTADDYARFVARHSA